MKRESLTDAPQYAYHDRNYRRLGWVFVALAIVVYLVILAGAIVVVVDSDPAVGIGMLTVVIIMGWPSFGLAAAVSVAVMMWHDAARRASRNAHSNGEN